MRRIEKVGVWPVGLVGGLMVEMPVVNSTTGRVVGFNSNWRPERPFPIDMAGFAINLQLLLDHPEAKFSLTAERGYQETEILKNIITRDQLEPLAKMCSEVILLITKFVFLPLFLTLGENLKASQGERRQLPLHSCIPPITVAGFMHLTNQRTPREKIVASLPIRLPRENTSIDGLKFALELTE